MSHLCRICCIIPTLVLTAIHPSLAESAPRNEAVLAALHAAIQDGFTRHAVQIMSPHYRADPERPKIVAPADWHVAPGAAPRQSDTRS